MPETVLHQSAQFGFLGVSATNAFGQVGPDIMIYLGEATVRTLKTGIGGCATS